MFAFSEMLKMASSGKAAGELGIKKLYGGPDLARNPGLPGCVLWLN